MGKLIFFMMLHKRCEKRKEARKGKTKKGGGAEAWTNWQGGKSSHFAPRRMETGVGRHSSNDQGRETRRSAGVAAQGTDGKNDKRKPFDEARATAQPRLRTRRKKGAL